MSARVDYRDRQNRDPGGRGEANRRHLPSSSLFFYLMWFCRMNRRNRDDCHAIRCRSGPTFDACLDATRRWELKSPTWDDDGHGALTLIVHACVLRRATDGVRSPRALQVSMRVCSLCEAGRHLSMRPSTLQVRSGSCISRQHFEKHYAYAYVQCHVLM